MFWVSEACKLLTVNRTAFYAWLDSQPTISEEQDSKLSPLIRIIFKQHRRSYGARRIADELKDLG
ncbi:MAG: transposase, partial [Planctomyces sp.]|nr:transposase [Planctomyces sp.]